MKILVTGAAGTLMGFLIRELISCGYEVVGLDNMSRHGGARPPVYDSTSFSFFEVDSKNTDALKEHLASCDHFVCGAAMVGGAKYIRSRPYDILAENERIAASEFDAAIWAHSYGHLKKITLLSSSMVYENTTAWPSKEGDEFKIPPPNTTYGLQKLALAYFAKSAWDEFKLPYTILTLFNLIGLHTSSSDVATFLTPTDKSHLQVLPDLIERIMAGQDPLTIYGDGNQKRHFTSGQDLARGIRLSLLSENATNQTINLASDKTTTIRELAEMVWKHIYPNRPFRYIECQGPKHDVKVQIADTTKAKLLLNFTAQISLEEIVRETILALRAPAQGDRLPSGNPS